MNIASIVDELTRDLTAVPVPKAKSEVRRILQEKLEALLGEIKEDIAKALYDQRSYFGDGIKPSWVVGGNSDVQNECRAVAAAIIESKK